MITEICIVIPLELAGMASTFFLSTSRHLNGTPEGRFAKEMATVIMQEKLRCDELNADEAVDKKVANGPVAGPLAVGKGF